MSSDMNRDTGEKILHERALALAREQGGIGIWGNGWT